MNKSIIAVLTILSFLNTIGFAAEATIYGTSPEWSNSKIMFYKYNDLITQSEGVLGKTTISREGKFEVSITVDKTTFVFTDLGVYRAYFYAEPGKKYEIILPPKIEKTQEDLLNPYFEESYIQLGIANVPPDDINVQIRMFNDMYNPYYNKHVKEVIEGKDFSGLDKDIEKMEKSFKNVENTFFNNFRKYRYAHLRHLALQHKAKSISEKFFVEEPVLPDNQAYMDILHQVFDNYFQHHGRTESGKKIYEDINTNKDYTGLKKTLSKNSIFKNDSLLELVILKCLYEEFYSDRFSRSGIIAILDTIISEPTIEEYKHIAENIRHEITKLSAGYAPPVIELYDQDSNLVTLDQLKGKYVYLNFCTCSSYTCIKEFEMLSGIYERHKKIMEVVTVSTDFFDNSLKEFLRKNNYNWKILYYGNNPEILKDYDIRAYPTYFLIGRDGNLIQSPAPGPNENFENKLFEIMKSKGDL